MNIKIFILAFMLPMQAFAAEDMLSVAAQRANVRSGPGTDFDILWEASKLYPLEVVERKGNWVMVSDYERDEGWIYKTLLSNTPTIVVVTQKANIRQGPGTEYESAWVVDKEYSLKVLDTSGDWLKITDEDGLSGWIHKSVTWGFTDQPLVEKDEAY
ncbi:MAG: hypothetical protein AUJ51_04655 [Elusimicrobia bacterium CG1_02_56_21]|nr:MAG: hypothetical protein AUJ51_04655 [Elusimicrobia bacterium CG1_02_56_21]